MKSPTCIVRSCVLVLSLLTLTSVVNADPINSPMWEYLRAQFLPAQPYQFDQRIQVLTPQFAEDSRQVPIAIDASAIGDVEKIMILADISPFQLVLEYWPHDLPPVFTFNMKVQQGTGLRAAVLTKSGQWHIGSGYIEATGGGCSAPSIGLADPAWQDHLGSIEGRWFAESEQGGRLKYSIIHPQDTGLANGIPAFFIQRMQVSSAQEKVLARMHMYEPVSENPRLTLATGPLEGPIYLSMWDNNGNEFGKVIEP